MKFDKPSYAAGYYHAYDEIMNWINSQDEKDVKKFRHNLYRKCLVSKPYKEK